MLLLQSMLYIFLCLKMHPFKENPHQMFDFFVIQCMTVFIIFKIIFKVNIMYVVAYSMVVQLLLKKKAQLLPHDLPGVDCVKLHLHPF